MAKGAELCDDMAAGRVGVTCDGCNAGLRELEKLRCAACLVAALLSLLVSMQMLFSFA